MAGKPWVEGHDFCYTSNSARLVRRASIYNFPLFVRDTEALTWPSERIQGNRKVPIWRGI